MNENVRIISYKETRRIDFVNGAEMREKPKSKQNTCIQHNLSKSLQTCRRRRRLSNQKMTNDNLRLSTNIFLSLFFSSILPNFWASSYSADSRLNEAAWLQIDKSIAVSLSISMMRIAFFLCSKKEECFGFCTKINMSFFVWSNGWIGSLAVFIQ